VTRDVSYFTARYRKSSICTIHHHYLGSFKESIRR
jgi:hypothetical protein